MATTTIGIVSIVPKGKWNSTITYNELNLVRHNNATYLAISSNQGCEPGVTSGWNAYWMPVTLDGGVGSPTATAQFISGTVQPTVTVTASGEQTNKVFNFHFGIPTPPYFPILKEMTVNEEYTLTTTYAYYLILPPRTPNGYTGADIVTINGTKTATVTSPLLISYFTVGTSAFSWVWGNLGDNLSQLGIAANTLSITAKYGCRIYAFQ